MSPSPSASASCSPTPKGLRSEEHTSELQSQSNLVCRLLLEKKKKSMAILMVALLRILCYTKTVLHVTPHKCWYIDSSHHHVDHRPTLHTTAAVYRIEEHITHMAWHECRRTQIHTFVDTALAVSTNSTNALMMCAFAFGYASELFVLFLFIPTNFSLLFFFFFKASGPPQILPFFPTRRFSD